MVETITLPVDVPELTALDSFDYDEAFAMDTDAVRTPEQWARLILEGAAPAMSAVMLRGWKVLGLRLAPLGSDGHILGWQIQHSGPQAIVLGVESRIGITARIVVQVRPTRLVWAMLVGTNGSPAAPRGR